ncbi:hypothetical protein HELRODRAFT_187761 [Helobdella robusta]|uniref:C2 domain-containing protein n=1 Tax=Helobdella robusta TaxID=6412 RepID=T1FPC8_HELRO|nr:hypothetical protein HELRODRAFT_187761 [Helobdella robusta]ESO11945.1 hypothetical protein HELRODRAFT_187761 [Helobdella robusta]
MATTAATAAASNDAKNRIGTDFINLNMNPLKENIKPFVTSAPSSAQHPSILGDLDAMLMFGEHLRDAMLKASISNSRQLFQTQANMQKNNIADELLSGDDINTDVQPVELILDSIKQFPSALNIFNSDARHGKPGPMFDGVMLEGNHNIDVTMLASNSEDLLFDDGLLQELVYDNVRERIPNDNNSNAGEGGDEEEGEGRRERKERKRSRSLVVEGHSIKLHSNRAKSSTSAVAYNHKPPNSHAGVSKSKRCSFGGVTRHRTNILPASYPAELTVTIRDFLFTDQSFFKQMTSKISTPPSSSTADVSFKSRSFYITCDVVRRRATSTSKTSASSSQQASTHSTPHAPDDDVLSSYKTKPFTRGSANSTVVTFNEEFSMPILIGLKRTRHDGVVVDDDDGDADGDDDIDEEMKNVCLIFKVFQHIPFSSIKPKQIGVCTFPLKWFQQGDLSITEALIVKHQHTNLLPSPPRHRHHQHPASKHKFASAAEAGQSIGLLKVHIELHRKVAENGGESSNDGDADSVNEPVINADVDAAGKKTYVVDCDEDDDEEEEEDGRGSDGGSHSDKFVKDDAYKVSSKTSDQKQGTKQDTSAHIGLFISRAEMIPRNKKEELNEHLHNYYIVVRSFWLKEPTKTPVVWSSILPLFNFRQVAPVHLKDALQKMKKMNMVVVEVWNKKPSSDLLVGLCKLSLDQFVLTFSDSSMWKSLLHNKYPVVAVNDAVEIRCPIEGQVTGHLYVKLVMGSLDQVTEFDLNPFAQNEDEDSIFSLGGNGNNDNDDETSELVDDYMNDVRKVSKWRKVVGKKSIGEATTLRRSSILSGRDVMLNEHTFMVYIDSIIDFKCTEGQQWSDAECYVQYTFLYQPSPSIQSFNRQHLGRIAVKSTRTSPVKYSTNMSFGESFQHIILHRIVYHIQQIISKVFSGVGNENDMTFEVWCRRYQPVVCDVLVAKLHEVVADIMRSITSQAYLPLTSVYQMLIHRPSSDSSFIDLSLPLFSSSKEGGHLATSHDQGGSGVCGYLRLRLDYETRTRKKAALQLLGHHLPLSNYLQTGLNVYLTASLSFLPIGNEKSTQTVTKTFHPDLFSSFEFACPLFWKNPSSRDNKPMTLAHIFNNAYLLIKVFHQNTDATAESLLGLDVNLKGVPINPLNKASVLTNNFSVTNAASAMSAPSYVNDVLLGVVIVPLTNFPIKSSGLRGWFPIESSAAYSDLERRDYVGGSKAKVVLTGDVNNVVGGVELMLKIPSKNEREAVLSVGRSLGWSPVNQVADASFFTEERNSLKKFNVSITINNLIISPKMLPAIGAFAHSDINSDGHMNADVTGKCSNLFNIVDSTEEGNVDTACGIPLHTRCYLRYKFFDQKVSMSRLFPMFMVGEQLFVTGAYREKFRICSSAMFAWYLAEERLEVEIWMTGRDESGANNGNEANNEAGHDDGNSNAVNANEFPKPSDHLVGAGYIDFIELADLKKVKCSIRNSSMIYNASCDNIGESSFDYVITFADDIPSAKLDKILELISKGSLPPNLFSSALNPNFPDFSFLGHVATGVDVVGSACADIDLLTGATKKMSQTAPSHEQPSKKKKFVDSKDVFKARLSIERAYHLQDVPVSGVLVVPSAYVTYNTAESEEPVSSHVISHDNNPVWYHDNDVLLSKEMLLARDKNLIIKVWHKIGGDGGIGGNRKSSTSSHLKPDKFADKVIGYVSVNLRPLTTRNFFNICGYYNIIDLAGSCKGQIKVCVTPMQWSNEAQQVHVVIVPAFLLCVDDV